MNILKTIYNPNTVDQANLIIDKKTYKFCKKNNISPHEIIKNITCQLYEDYKNDKI